MNEDFYIISLFDLTGKMVQPWVDNGYKAVIVDNKHPEGITVEGNITKINCDLRKPFTLAYYLPEIQKENIAFVSAFPPCTHLAVSGAAWFKGKGLRALEESIAMFATASEFCEWSEAAYMIENPVSTISTYWRKPDHYFHPHMFTGFSKSENYTKKTALWVGNHFTMPEENIDSSLGEPDKKYIHNIPGGKKQAGIRNMTPEGFAMAIHEANKI